MTRDTINEITRSPARKRRYCWGRPALFAAALALSAGAALPAHSHDCDLRLTTVGDAPLNLRGEYDPLGSGPFVQRGGLRVTSQRGGCQFFIGFAPANDALRHGSDRLPYRISAAPRDAEILADLPNATENQLLTGNVGAKGESVELDYYLIVQGGLLVRRGPYHDEIRVTLYVGGHAELERRASRTINARVRVPAVVSVQVSTQSGRRPLHQGLHVVDFGQLHTGERRGFSLEVLANAGYSVDLESENRGALRGRGGDRIPYRLEADGRVLNLASPVRLSSSNRVGRSGLIAAGDRGQRHRFDIEIGDVERAPSGDYRDSLLVTVTAR